MAEPAITTEHNQAVAPDALTTVTINHHWRRLVCELIAPLAWDGFWSGSQVDIETSVNNANALLEDLYDAWASLTDMGSLIVVYDEKPDGSHGGTSVIGAQTRQFNTIQNEDSVAGVSLGGNQLTLPSGEYWLIYASAPAGRVDRNQAYLYNLSATAALLDASGHEVVSEMGYFKAAFEVFGQVTFAPRQISLASSTIIEMRHYTAQAIPLNGLGNGDVLSGVPNIFSQLAMVKLT